MKRLELKYEEKFDYEISNKLENFELIQSITKKPEKLSSELQNNIEKQQHRKQLFQSLQRNMEENKQENIIISVGDVVKETMSNNK